MGNLIYRTKSINTDLNTDLNYESLHNQNEVWLCRIFVVLVIILLINLLFLTGIMISVGLFNPPGIKAGLDSTLRLADTRSYEFLLYSNNTMNSFVEDMKELVKSAMQVVMMAQKCSQQYCDASLTKQCFET